MPEMGVRPPAFTLATVRAMVPVAGMPAVNPMAIANDTNWTTAPNLKGPSRISGTPAMMVAAMSPYMPSMATTAVMIVAKDGRGPRYLHAAAAQKRDEEASDDDC